MAVRAKNVRSEHRSEPPRRHAKRAQRSYRVIVREVPVTPAVGSSQYDFCAPIRSGGPLSKQERKALRRKALYYLNLHCPAG